MTENLMFTILHSPLHRNQWGHLWHHFKEGNASYFTTKINLSTSSPISPRTISSMVGRGIQPVNISSNHSKSVKFVALLCVSDSLGTVFGFSTSHRGAHPQVWVAKCCVRRGSSSPEMGAIRLETSKCREGSSSLEVYRCQYLNVTIFVFTHRWK